jgi:hypothetical protein
VQTIQRLACGERLKGDHNVVRASEHEGLVAQTTYYLQNATT